MFFGKRQLLAIHLTELSKSLSIIALIAIFQKVGLCHACSSSEGLLLCRYCGHEVAFEKDIHFVPSRLALSHRNNTIIGEHRISVQLFENPQGFQFEVITFKKADVLKHWPSDKHFTWFPGYSWTVATCPRCKTHLGWAFQPSDWPDTVTRQEFENSDRTFVALIIHRLLQEHFALTHLMTPKAFKS